ncbi:MAG: hypothetical protein ACKVVT_16505 [Dehalococcoidia bacterium]
MRASLIAVFLVGAVVALLLPNRTASESDPSPFAFDVHVAAPSLTPQLGAGALVDLTGGVAAALLDAPGVGWFGVGDQADRVGAVATTTLIVVLSPGGDIARLCTGMMIDWTAVLTAAHCITDSGPVGGILVAPGANSVAAWQWPWGTALVRGWTLPRAWIEARLEFANLALLHLPDEAFPTHPGTFSILAALPDSYFEHDTSQPVFHAYLAKPSLGRMLTFFAGTLRLDGPTFAHSAVADETADGAPFEVRNSLVDERFLAGMRTGVDPAGSRGIRFLPEHLDGLKDFCKLQDCEISTVDRVNNPVPLPRPPIGHASRFVMPEPGAYVQPGPFGGPIPPAVFLSCLPDTGWSALYVWSESEGRWRHYLNTALGAPAATNAPEAGGIAILRRHEQVTLVTMKKTSSPSFWSGTTISVDLRGLRAPRCERFARWARRSPSSARSAT